MQIYNRQDDFVALRELNVLTYLMPWRKLEFLNRNNITSMAATAARNHKER